MSDVVHVKAPTNGPVLVSVVSVVTEKEIFEDRGNIIQTLHAAYLTLNDSMSEFQRKWDANPKLAFLDSLSNGAMQGGGDWFEDQKELFDKKTWVDLGNKVESFAGESLDRMAAYSKREYKALESVINKHIQNPDRTLYNWAWWQQTVENQAKSLVDAKVTQLKAAKAEVEQTVKTVSAAAEMARKLYKHRDAILSLPTLIAAGDPKPIQRFVDNELMEIDPGLAKAIRNDPNFAIVLEIIADNESALSYVAYISLMVEAIPPNFYAFLFGKGAAYAVIELVLLVISAFLSAGTAAAARIAALAARLLTASAKAAGVAKKIKGAKIALDAFIRVLEDLMAVAGDLHMLGAKLLKARAKGLTVRGNANTRLVARKESIRREKKCLACGHTDHATPRHRRGNTKYK